ncbi:MAG: hypothetical protein WBG64_16395 [Thermoanaerobaculia bacterium]
MPTMLLGWFLIVVGPLFILIGVAGAARAAFSRSRGSAGADEASGVAELIKAVTALLKAILAGPQWLLFTLVGIGLIYAGQRVLAGEPIIPGLG